MNRTYSSEELMPLEIRRITPYDLPLMDGLLVVFGRAFHDLDTYTGNPPSPEYLQSILASETFIALAAVQDEMVVGGLTAYEFKKFEQERSEIYIYDLAVAEGHRRKGIATALISEVRAMAVARGAWVIFVQADTGPEDEPAIELYSRLGTREEVLHFDIRVGPDQG